MRQKHGPDPGQAQQRPVQKLLLFSSLILILILFDVVVPCLLLQEALCVSLQLNQLDQTVLSGISGQMWTNVVQDVYQDFLCHVTVLSECDCDPTDPDNQVTPT